MINLWMGRHQIALGQILGRPEGPAIRRYESIRGVAIRVLSIGFARLGLIWTTYGGAR